MKAVLISIQPKGVELIASGKKTVEVRKTRPKIKTPFKCYIYCTEKKPVKLMNVLYINESRIRIRHGTCTWFSNSGESFIANPVTDGTPDYAKADTFKAYRAHGKVIGEFVCDKINEYRFPYSQTTPIEDLNESCLTAEEFCRYGGGKAFYGWHISDLKIYDKPKELGEFTKCAYPKEMCLQDKCEYWGYSGCFNRITRPPQSFMYVEEIHNGEDN